jgi:hypothetical protein
MGPDPRSTGQVKKQNNEKLVPEHNYFYINPRGRCMYILKEFRKIGNCRGLVHLSRFSDVFRGFGGVPGVSPASRQAVSYWLINIPHAFGVNDAAYSLGLPMAGFLCIGWQHNWAETDVTGLG